MRTAHGECTALYLMRCNQPEHNEWYTHRERERCGNKQINKCDEELSRNNAIQTVMYVCI